MDIGYMIYSYLVIFLPRYIHDDHSSYLIHSSHFLHFLHFLHYLPVFLFLKSKACLLVCLFVYCWKLIGTIGMIGTHRINATLKI